MLQYVYQRKEQKMIPIERVAEPDIKLMVNKHAIKTLNTTIQDRNFKLWASGRKPSGLYLQVLKQAGIDCGD